MSTPVLAITVQENYSLLKHIHSIFIHLFSGNHPHASFVVGLKFDGTGRWRAGGGDCICLGCQTSSVSVPSMRHHLGQKAEHKSCLFPFSYDAILLENS